MSTDITKAGSGDLSLQDLTGVQKAALLMIALDVDSASEVLKQIDAIDVEKISAEITQVRNIPTNVISEVLDDFHSMITAQEYVLEGGVDYAQQVLEKSFGIAKATEIIDKVKSLTTLHGFDVLKKADSVQLVNFLNKEHPQTIALILSHLNPDQTADALKELPDELRSDVAYRIATLGKIAPQTLKQIERVVDDLAGFSINQTTQKLGGTKTIAGILNRTPVGISKEIIAEILEKDEDIAYEIKRLMFLFEDIVHIQDKDIQRILKEVDRKDLAFSLKVSEENVRDKVFRNMSERAADLLKEELQFMGPVKLKEVEAAQARVVDVIKRLEEQEEITINMGGGSEEVYV